MRATNEIFDTANALDYKTPVYLIHFDGETTDFANKGIGNPDNTIKKYLVKITGLSQKVTPEEGKASIGNITFILQDYDDEITVLLATDAFYFHRKKTTIKAGYLGMSESDMLIIMTGWITGIKMTKDLTGYEFNITDPQKWLQRKIFRGAEDSTVAIQGNPINIILAILTSTGNETNGNYDYYSSSVGLGISTDHINVSGIEAVRDDWYPGDTNYMKFSITKREKAKDWLEREVFKVLNIYPIIDGEGRFNLKPFKPPIASKDVTQSFSDGNIKGFPKYDTNLKALINEVELHYDYNGSAYATQEFNIDGTSLNNRGPGKKPLTIKSRGVHTSHSPGSLSGRATDINQKRKAKVLGRFATPPLKINISTFFSRWISEPGDIVFLTHRLLPDLENGVRGITDRRMEIVNRSIDWQNGRVNLELLDSGFDRAQYGAINPSMNVIAGISTTVFSVSAADAAKFEIGWYIDIFDSQMHSKATNLEITAIGGPTADFENTSDVEFEDTADVEFDEQAEWQITVGSTIGSTPSADWIVLFSDYGNCISAQQLYSFIYASGHGMAEADIICP